MASRPPPRKLLKKFDQNSHQTDASRSFCLQSAGVAQLRNTLFLTKMIDFCFLSCYNVGYECFSRERIRIDYGKNYIDR